MISLTKFIFGYLTNSDNTKKNLENELAKELAKLDARCLEHKNEIVEKKENTLEPSKCFHRTGIITYLEAKHGVIDDVLCFELTAAKTVQELTIGSKVTYLAYKHSEDFPVKIVKIESIIDEFWEKPSEKQVQEFLSDLKSDKPEYFSIHQRSILGLVVDRRGSYLTVDTDNNDPIVVDLETVNSQFVPFVGDQVYLNCNVQSDMTFVDMTGQILEVTFIHPGRSKTAKGTITSINNEQKFGDVDQKYYFFYDALDYVIPQIGDKVAVDAIESIREKYNWRCIKVVLLQKSDVADNSKVESKTSMLTQNKKGIVIVDDNLKVIFNDLNEKAEIKMIVKNDADHQHKVMRSCFFNRKAESQLTLKKPGMNESFYIQPGEQVEFVFIAAAKFYGKSKEMFVITFGGSFKIGRCIEVEVMDNDNIGPSIGTGANIYKNTAYTMQVWNKNYDVIPGMKIRKAPNFVYVKMGQYDVPFSLKTAVLNLYTSDEINEKLDYMLSFFKHSLDFSNYEQCFHNLLYLEEIQLFHNIRRYDMDRAHFTKEKEFLALKMENIAETRPSLILGDSVRATNPWASQNDQQCFEGLIHKVLNNRILIKFTQSFNDKYNGEDYRLEFFFSRVSLRKQHHAVRKATIQLGADFLFPSKIMIQSPQLDVKLIDGQLYENNELLNWYNDMLNDVQKETVQNILRGEARPMPYIIFGPPGTGKTITVLETILQICTRVTDSRILVGTPTNSAANLITERLIESKVLLPGDFIRLVSYNMVERELIPEHLLPYCATCNIACEGTVEDDMIITESGLKLRCNSTYIGRHRITISTCNTLGTLMQMQFPRDHFTHAIIDESGQCLETEALIPLTMVNKYTGQIILAGDPMQLGPIVLSKFALDRGFENSFLVRLLDRFPYQKDFTRFKKGYDPRLVTKLVYNYRSLPSILKVYSELFYDGDLIPMITETYSNESKMMNQLSDIFPNPLNRIENHAVFFVGIRGANRQCNDSPSWFNSAEAKSIFLFLLKLYKKGITDKDIGIITPYQQQVKAIRTLINDSNIIAPKVGTVEEFQGQERNIIMISTVRSTSKMIQKDQKHSLGFVKSSKRMNVAISRAKVLLVIFGNPHLLVQDSNWTYLINYCIQNNAYTGCDLPQILCDKEK